jgi:hypothetical protein
MAQELTKVEVLEKKQELIIEYYEKLKELKIQRRELNRKISFLEDRFSELISAKNGNELSLFNEINFPE